MTYSKFARFLIHLFFIGLFFILLTLLYCTNKQNLSLMIVSQLFIVLVFFMAEHDNREFLLNDDSLIIKGVLFKKEIKFDSIIKVIFKRLIRGGKAIEIVLPKVYSITFKLNFNENQIAKFSKNLESYGIEIHFDKSWD